MTTHLVFGDSHCRPGTTNDRALWLGKLIVDVKPDIVVDMGDGADMESLCSYEKGKASFVGKTYKADVDSFLDFQDKLWSSMKKNKKKMPKRYYLVGNHEQRIARALEVQPELVSTIGYKDLCLEDRYDEVRYYTGATPGTVSIDGITYGHYIVTGVSGRPTLTANTASLALSKTFRSVTQGHTHLLGYSTQPTIDGSRINSLNTGCFMDTDPEWAGSITKLWYRGCFIKRSVADGNYDLEVISLKRLRKEYG